jgi:hypothetical protein
MKVVVIFCFVFLVSCLYAQQPSNTDIVTGFDGSFQIEIHNVRYQPHIPGNILEIISNYRLDNQTVYYPLDENIRIKIISRNELSSPEFQRLDLIKYY